MRKLRMGMVGGGEGAFIGAVHRMAATLDGKIELVAGAFSANTAKSKRSGKSLFLPDDRVYGSYSEMIEREVTLPLAERIDFVSVVTPNDVHFDPCKKALEAGLSVVCDKPLCLTIDEAEQLVELTAHHDAIFCVTHNYSGFPMVKEAKALVAAGEIGVLRKVVVEYSQGWLSSFLESSDHKQAVWRTDPARSGVAGCMGDIGSHAAHLAEYICGQCIVACAANLQTYVAGRKLDDDVFAVMTLAGGARVQLLASQIAFGQENALSIHLYGSDGALHWHQQEPNTLRFDNMDGQHTIRTGVGNLHEETKGASRLPAGHPEGYIEAFANVYLGFAHALSKKLGIVLGTSPLTFPTVEDGLKGMRIIQAVVTSSNAGGKLVKL